MKAVRFALFALVSAIVFATSAAAQTCTRPAVTVWDTQVQQATGGSGNKLRITLRVWHERIQHADGNHSWYLNYSVEALDKNFWGNWKWATQLATITYSLTVMQGTSGVTATHNGTIQLNHASSKQGILFDGGSISPSLVPLVVSATVTAARYGGSSGISITNTH
ncbi:MAG: hypothetical protein HZA32_00795 [Opitutae bacterium]|nr:hypothetical protein [Opitutae bacterium]